MKSSLKAGEPMTSNKEVITGSDYKRMIAGAYSEFLLEYENINGLEGGGRLAGTHILRTMNAAIMPLADVKDTSIGGLANRVATAAVFGARGNAGVVLAQMLRGIAKGISGKYNATSSEFGKAFQYGILHAQRVIPEQPDRPFITAAKAAAKGAYHAVRANMPISEILAAALSAGEKSLTESEKNEAGSRIMSVFLNGCLKGLDGNFVSPAVSLSLGLKSWENISDPRKDMVRPYCVTFSLKNPLLRCSEVENQLKEFSNFALVNRWNSEIEVHLHTNFVGHVMEQAVGWGTLRNIRITSMSEPHALNVHDALMNVAALAVAEDEEMARRLQEAGASIIVSGSAASCPSVAELVNAAHSDMADSYVLVASSPDYRLVFRQAKRLLGSRVELVLADSVEDAERALQRFSTDKTASENAEVMSAAIK